jgi:hypothetical protein
MYRFALLVVAVTLLSGSVAQAASYQQWGGTIIDPIMYRDGGARIATAGETWNSKRTCTTRTWRARH